jgi:2-methylisocitrate lyase-like PEP mutase family enzyme
MTPADHFLELHRPGDPLLMPNPWDVGSAKLLESLGFQALATTSSGFAASLGRLDGSVTRDEAVAHAATIVEATGVPVSADFENCFAHEPEGVAETVRQGIEAGLAGCSVEDNSKRDHDPVYEFDLAVERVRAAVEAAEGRIVITARAENHVTGRDDLPDTIARLQAFQEAGAHVLFAPGLRELEQIREVVQSVDRPVNVLALPGEPTVAHLAEAGVARISVGGAFAFAAYGELVVAAEELRDRGTFGYWERAGRGVKAVRSAFGGS